MSNVINLRDVRAARMVPDASYFVRIDLYAAGIGCELIDAPEDVDSLRSISNELLAVARHLLDRAHEISGEARDDVRLMVTIPLDDGGAVWTSNRVDAAQDCAIADAVAALADVVRA